MWWWKVQAVVGQGMRVLARLVSRLVAVISMSMAWALGLLIVIEVLSGFPLTRDHFDLKKPRPIESRTGHFRFTHSWETSVGSRRPVQVGTLTLTSDIPNAHLVWMTETFGYPRHWYGQEHGDDEYATRGLKRSDGGWLYRNRIAADYRWLVESSEPVGEPMARAIQELLDRRRWRHQRDLWEVTATFVQSLEYRVPPEVRETSDGTRVETIGVFTPVEVLYNGWGDCDSKSTLFATILTEFPNERVVLLYGAKHMFVGIRGTPRHGEQFIRIRNVPYVLVELTSPWPIGRVARDVWKKVHEDVYVQEEL